LLVDLDQPEILEMQDRQGQPDSLDLMVKRVNLEPLGHLVSQGREVSQELQGLKALEVRRDNPDQQGLRDLKDNEVILA